MRQVTFDDLLNADEYKGQNYFCFVCGEEELYLMEDTIHLKGSSYMYHMKCRNCLHECYPTTANKEWHFNKDRFDEDSRKMKMYLDRKR